MIDGILEKYDKQVAMNGKISVEDWCEAQINQAVVAQIPSIWGPSTWKYLTLLALRYPVHPTEERKIKMHLFLEQFFMQLGCGSCVLDFFKYNVDHPVDLESRNGFVCWVLDAHNYVNKKQGKPAWTKEEFVRFYVIEAQRSHFQRFINKHTPTKKVVGWCQRNNLISMVVVVMIITIILLIITALYAVFKPRKSHHHKIKNNV